MSVCQILKVAVFILEAQHFLRTQVVSIDSSAFLQYYYI